MSRERPLADLLQEFHDAKKTGALYVSIVETSEDLVRIYIRNGDIYYIRYGTAIGSDCLDILEYYNLWGATYFDGVAAPKGAVSNIPPTEEIISLIRGLNKKVKVQ
ncbi:MAG TPA: DUF4388 domain-containing protein [Nitrospirota bacterium]|nr:DUF4388 domain-containing protein [Nitrospirota bacterium]